MNCMFETYENGRPLQRVNYYDIPLYEGKTFTADTAGSNAVPASLISSDGVIPADETISQFDSDDVVVQIACGSGGEGHGQVYGSGAYIRGDAVKLIALANDGYLFMGWHDEEGRLVSVLPMYEFTAREEQKLIAQFVKSPEPVADEPDEPSDEPSITVTGWASGDVSTVTLRNC